MFQTAFLVKHDPHHQFILTVPSVNAGVLPLKSPSSRNPIFPPLDKPMNPWGAELLVRVNVGNVKLPFVSIIRCSLPHPIHPIHSIPTHLNHHGATPFLRRYPILSTLDLIAHELRTPLSEYIGKIKLYQNHFTLIKQIKNVKLILFQKFSFPIESTDFSQ